VAAHLPGRPTGSPGKCQVARRPSPLLHLNTGQLANRSQQIPAMIIWGDTTDKNATVV